ncbi:MAG: hypothetical protein OEZ01_05935 [Candidatus Heimdallarchaeota archaeon]|nr:hypothetical protein [Candidatus Heimdallarchaeota archaeon]MDH5645526.1 hypothetical protein [Candidatus Heimdallarchaeota archaeon]
MNGILSLVLFILEVIILLTIKRKAKNHKYLSYLLVLVFLLLSYQLSEFLICNTSYGDIIVKLGFVAISFLPPVGHHFSAKLIKRKIPDYYLSYIAGMSFAIYFAFIPNTLTVISCNPVYAVYTQYPNYRYSIFYFGVILYSIFLLSFAILRKSPNIDHIYVKMMLLGYILFLLPMIILVTIDLFFLRTVTSIMCKFAFLLACTMLSIALREETSYVRKVRLVDF